MEWIKIKEGDLSTYPPKTTLVLVFAYVDDHFSSMREWGIYVMCWQEACEGVVWNCACPCPCSLSSTKLGWPYFEPVSWAHLPNPTEK